MKKRVKRGFIILAVLSFMLACSFGVVAAGEKTLIAAGTAFGVKFHTNGAMIAGVPGDTGPAAEAGLKKGDIITGINGEPVTSAEQFSSIVKSSAGAELTLDYQSGKLHHTVRLTPIADANGDYKLGIWVKDSAAGIGTITFIDPETMRFAGLGHGICDAGSGTLLPFAGGTAEEVELSGITIGESGAPGELRGSFCGKKLGRLLGNEETGIYGVLSAVPVGLEKERFPVGHKSDVKQGKAYIFTTVDESGRKMYEIEITNIEKEGASRNFLVHVTDPDLLEKTGGIVQGMSGSPIIQNGKIIGAVTHVLMSDPTRGYGILIENMLNETV